MVDGLTSPSALLLWSVKGFVEAVKAKPTLILLRQPNKTVACSAVILTLQISGQPYLTSVHFCRPMASTVNRSVPRMRAQLPITHTKDGILGT